MSEPLQQRDIAITSNPADRIQTFHVTLMDKATGEEVKTTTHNYSIEECALDVKSKIMDKYQVVHVLQPDTKTVLNSSDIAEL